MPTTRGSLSSKMLSQYFNVKRLWSVVCSIVLCSVVRSVEYQGQEKKTGVSSSLNDVVLH